MSHVVSEQVTPIGAAVTANWSSGPRARGSADRTAPSYDSAPIHRGHHQHQEFKQPPLAELAGTAGSASDRHLHHRRDGGAPKAHSNPASPISQSRRIERAQSVGLLRPHSSGTGRSMSHRGSRRTETPTSHVGASRGGLSQSPAARGSNHGVGSRPRAAGSGSARGVGPPLRMHRPPLATTASSFQGGLGSTTMSFMSTGSAGLRPHSMSSSSLLPLEASPYDDVGTGGGGGGLPHSRSGTGTPQPADHRRSLSATTPAPTLTRSGSAHKLATSRPRSTYTPEPLSDMWSPQNNAAARKMAFKAGAPSIPSPSRSSTAAAPDRNGIASSPYSVGGRGGDRTLQIRPVPLLHFLNEHEAEMIETDSERLLDEWLDSYAHEDQSFASAVLEAEVKLRRAEIFCQSHGYPAPLLTAVAFEVYDSIANVFGRYENLMRVLGRIFKSSVYADAPPSNEEDPAAELSVSVREYVKMSPFFVSQRQLQQDKSELLSIVNNLKQTMVKWEEERSTEMTGVKRGAKAVSTWQRVVMQEKHMRVVKGLETTIDRQEQTINLLTEAQLSSVGKLLDMFLVMDEPEQQATVWEIIKNVPKFWEDLLQDLMRLVPASLSNRVALNAMTLKDEVTQPQLVKFTRDFLRSVRVVETPGLQSNLIIEALIAARDVGPFMEPFARLLQEFERRCFIRFLVPIDMKCLKPKELREAQDGKPSPNTMDMHLGIFDPLLASFTNREQQFLLSDTVQSLGASALPPVINSLTSGALKPHLKEIPPDTREALLRALLEDAPQDMICSLLTCEHHNHDHNITPIRRRRAKVAAASGRRKLRSRTGFLRAISSMSDRKASTPRGPLRRESASLADGRDPSSPLLSEDDTTTSADDEPTPITRKPKPPSVSPWIKFMGPMPRSMRDRPRMDFEGVLNLIYDCYEKKVKSTNDLEFFPEFMRSFLVQKFGLPSISDGHLYSICDAVKRSHHRSKRLKLFGRMVGVLDRQRYSPRVAEIALNLYRNIFPKFSKTTLRGLREGRCAARLSDVLHALPLVFVSYRTPVSMDRICLNPTRKSALVGQVTSLGLPLKEFLKKSREAETAAMSGSLPGAGGGFKGSPSISALPLHLRGRRRSDSVSSTASAPAVTLSPKDTSNASFAADAEDASLLVHLPRMRDDELVVDMDEVMDLSIGAWSAQADEDSEEMGLAFKEFTKSRTSSFNYAAFTSFLGDVAPSHTYTTHQQLELFEELLNLAQSSEEKQITPAAVSVLARKYGITCINSSTVVSAPGTPASPKRSLSPTARLRRSGSPTSRGPQTPSRSPPPDSPAPPPPLHSPSPVSPTNPPTTTPNVDSPAPSAHSGS